MNEAANEKSPETESPKLYDRPLGYNLWGFLEQKGRIERPKWVFEQELDLPKIFGLKFDSRTTTLLRTAGVATVSDLLSVSINDLKRLGVSRDKSLAAVEVKVRRLEKFLKVTPELRLLRRLFITDSGRAPVELMPEDESDLRGEMAEIMQHGLKSDELDVLGLRFGLDDWQTRDLQEVAHELKIKPFVVKELEVRAINKMRRLGEELVWYLAR